MNFTDIVTEAVLSTEKLCLVAHATYFVFVAVLNDLFKKWKEKSPDVARAILCDTYT